jgi:hypothetical protein
VYSALRLFLLIFQNIPDESGIGQDKLNAFSNAESVEYSGKVIANLATDANKMGKTGKIVLVCDLAMEYGLTDDDGDVHDIRSISSLLTAYGHTWLAAWVPSFVRLPLFVMHYGSNKF